MKIKNLTTDRLILRTLNKDDLEDIYQIFSSDSLMIPYGMNNLSSLQGAKKLLDDMIEDGEWAITLKNTGDLIGTIGFVGYKEDHRRAEIAFELKEQYWHKGYMVEAMDAVKDYVFTDTSLNRLEAYVYPSNKASIKLLENSGFIKEGHLRDYVVKRGNLEDYLLYAILKRDYLS